MVQNPIHLKYELSRKDRFFSHFKEEGMWGVLGTIGSLIILTILISGTIFHTYRGAFYDAGVLFCFLLLWLFFSFVILDFKLWEILLVSKRKIDVIVTNDAFEILGTDDRWMIWLDGITGINAFVPEMWTIHHFNGFELLIPSRLMSAELLEHLEERRRWGRTREGIEAVIRRGQMIQIAESLLDNNSEDRSQSSTGLTQTPENSESAPDRQGENGEGSDDPGGDE